MLTDAGVWMPYQPKVGDRVRIRLNPECEWCKVRLEDEAQIDKMVFDGLTGTVTSWACHPRSVEAHHNYAVGLDAMFLTDTCDIAGVQLAAVEMVPIEVKDGAMACD